MLNDHLVPMFTIKREKVLTMLADKIDSLDKARILAKEMLENAVLDHDKRTLATAIEFIDETTSQVAFLRDHLGARDSWDLSAAQLVEIRRALEPVALNPDKLKLSVDFTKTIATEVHNFNGRMKRF